MAAQEQKRVRWSLDVLHSSGTASDEDPKPYGIHNDSRENRLLVISLAVHVVFLAIIFYLSYGSKDQRSFLLAKAVRDEVLSAKGSSKFTTINGVSDYWQWLDAIIVPALYATHHINGDVLNSSNSLFTRDLVNRRVGVPRLRQHRVRYGPCLVRPDNTVLAKNYCEPSYDFTTADTNDAREYWREMVANPTNGKRESSKDDRGSKHNENLNGNSTPWNYMTAYELKGVPYMGIRAVYGGGGYVLNFGENVQNTTETLREYQKKQWLDERTRAVLLEFNIYNVNTNLFISVTMLVEFLVTGSATTHSTFRVFRLFHFHGVKGNVELAMQVVYCCFILFFTIRLIISIRRNRCSFFKKFWNIVDLLRITLAIVCIALYAVKQELTKYVRSWFKSPTHIFLNLQSLGAYDEIYSYTLGLVVFLATIQFLKMLQFNRRLRMLGDVLRLSYNDMRNFSFMFFVFIIAFSMTAFLLFGRVSGRFYNLASTIEGLMAIALGDLDYAEIQSAQTILAPIYFFTYVVVIYVILMTIFLSILNKAISEVKTNPRTRRGHYHLVSYIYGVLSSLCGWILAIFSRCKRRTHQSYSPTLSEEGFYVTSVTDHFNNNKTMGRNKTCETKAVEDKVIFV